MLVVVVVVGSICVDRLTHSRAWDNTDLL